MSLIFGYKIWVQNMGTQAGQAIPNFLDLAWLACVPINFVPKNKANFHSLFSGLINRS